MLKRIFPKQLFLEKKKEEIPKGRRNRLCCDDHCIHTPNRDKAFLPESLHTSVIEKIFQLMTDNQATNKNLMILGYFDSNHYGNKMG